MNLNNEQEFSEMQLEEYALKLDASDFASRSEAKNHKDVILPFLPQKRYLLERDVGPI